MCNVNFNIHMKYSLSLSIYLYLIPNNRARSLSTLMAVNFNKNFPHKTKQKRKSNYKFPSFPPFCLKYLDNNRYWKILFVSFHLLFSFPSDYAWLIQVWRLRENLSKSMESKVLVGLFALLLVSLLWFSSSKETGSKWS